MALRWHSKRDVQGGQLSSAKRYRVFACMHPVQPVNPSADMAFRRARNALETHSSNTSPSSSYLAASKSLRWRGRCRAKTVMGWRTTAANTTPCLGHVPSPLVRVGFRTACPGPGKVGWASKRKTRVTRVRWRRPGWKKILQRYFEHLWSDTLGPNGRGAGRRTDSTARASQALYQGVLTLQRDGRITPCLERTPPSAARPSFLAVAHCLELVDQIDGWP